MAKAKPIPSPDMPVVDAGGKINPVWFEYFKAREMVGLSDLPDIKLTALANGDAPVWDAVAKKWTNQPN